MMFTRPNVMASTASEIKKDFDRNQGKSCCAAMRA
jgi:hypothetical protein